MHTYYVIDLNRGFHSPMRGNLRQGAMEPVTILGDADGDPTCVSVDTEEHEALGFDKATGRCNWPGFQHLVLVRAGL